MFRSHAPLLLSTLVAITLLSSPALAETQEHAPPLAAAEAAPGHEIHWSYEGEGGPANWAKIKDDYKLCATGSTQSPIDLKATVSTDLPMIEVNYKSAPLTVLNNGHTIQVNYPEGSKMTVGGETFNLLQFHFHTPSEYTVEGKRYNMEVHFVHKNAAGELGVIGIMIEKGAEENAAAKAIWEHMPKTAGEPQTIAGATIDAAGFFPEDKSYYRLMGSLTTPPCSEGVHWHVLKTPIQFSEGQIATFKELFPVNARPLQEKNNRLIILDR